MCLSAKSKLSFRHSAEEARSMISLKGRSSHSETFPRSPFRAGDKGLVLCFFKRNMGRKD